VEYEYTEELLWAGGRRNITVCHLLNS